MREPQRHKKRPEPRTSLSDDRRWAFLAFIDFLSNYLIKLAFKMFFPIENMIQNTQKKVAALQNRKSSVNSAPYNEERN